MPHNQELATKLEAAHNHAEDAKQDVLAVLGGLLDHEPVLRWKFIEWAQANDADLWEALKRWVLASAYCRVVSDAYAAGRERRPG